MLATTVQLAVATSILARPMYPGNAGISDYTMAAGSLHDENMTRFDLQTCYTYHPGTLFHTWQLANGRRFSKSPGRFRS